ncbi:MAG TPA: glycosyltransferase family 61 protein [Pseudoalteromonas sp.]|uniref:Uncharacterized protein n=1 Tax=marine sediment metagenome TaxID=412755 RepID=A0A0F9TTL6_9ZZZZ|nr:WcbI family polysaccharide biosynthesis putative acetyltransferase [Pseudoalteromonas sp.]HDY93958.1 glycosyltransferase family 61 protein [Pseudoalteromonas sp.]HDZ33920.1 glycosyltransferase family 61 protein [Pseudoalteromonas sp.]
MANKKKVVVVGNCQARPIATLLETMSNEIEITKVAIVHLLNSDQESEYRSFFEDADYIIAQLVAPNYPCEFVQTSLLEQSYGDKLVKIVNIFLLDHTPYLSGLPADWRNKKTPLGDYHFPILFEQWKKGASIKEAASLLRESYINVSYGMVNESSSLFELQTREKKVDVKISDFLLKSKERLFYTYNHPKDTLLFEYAKRILNLLGMNIEYHDGQSKGFLDKIHPFFERDLHGYKQRGVSLIYTTEELVSNFYQFYSSVSNYCENKSTEKKINRENNIFNITDFTYSQYIRYDRRKGELKKLDNSFSLEEKDAAEVGEVVFQIYSKFSIPMRYSIDNPLEGPTRFLMDNRFEITHSVVKLDNVNYILPSGSLVNDEFIIKDSIYMSLLFFHPMFHNDKTTKWKWKASKNLNTVSTSKKSGVLAICHHRFYHQYFHWFFDVLPRIWLLDKSDVEYDSIFIGNDLNKDFICSSLQALGVNQDKIVMMNNNIVDFDSVLYPTSKIIEERFVRPSLGDGVHYKGGWDPRYIKDINKAFREYNFKQSNGSGNKKIFVSRDDATHRAAVNNDELLSLVNEFGFEVFVPGDNTFAEQVNVFSNASIILGIHGAGMTNILWAKPRSSKVIEIVVDGVDDPGYRYLSEMLGLSYYYVRSRPVGNSKNGIAFDDVEVDLVALKALLLDHETDSDT